MRHHLAIFLLLACLAAMSAETPSSDRIMAHTAWTTTALYFGLRVDDRLVVGNQTAPMSQPWLDDAIAVYLDLDPTNGDILDTDCVRVIVSAAGGVSVQRGDKGDWRDDPSWFQPGERGTIRLARRVNGALNDGKEPDTGYVVEMAFSWKLLGVTPPFRRSVRDPLPAIGYAVACYSQGETRAVSCWPDGVMEEDLHHPARWGQLQFLQNAQPLPATERLANAPLVMLDPFIDGELRATEWVMAGVVSFRKRSGQGVAPLEPGRQPVSLTAVWYSLDPEGKSLAHQPLEPLPPWVTPVMPLYHQPQVKAIRQAGIDALAVVLPGAPAAETRTRLLALVRALSAYDAASTAAFFYDVPPIVPVLDLSAESADPAKLAATLEAAAMDAFRAIPPRYRLTLPSPDGGACYPLIVVAPPNPGPLAAMPLAAVSERLRAALSLPVGWLLDAAWTGEETPPGVLARCAWDPSAGVQVGTGPLRTALIAPGVGARQGFLSRFDGETYANGWVKVTGAQPDFLLIRSWNEFARGTEIAASRQYGPRYLDATKLALMRLAEGRDFGLAVLSHTLPPVLRAGASYPLEVLIKNGSMQKLVSQSGFRVDYRVTRDNTTVLSGMATDKLALFDLSTSRIGFTLPTVAARRPLVPGDYRLHLDFSRNKVAFLTAPLLTERLGTLTIPFTVAKDAPRAQQLETAIPGAIGPARSTPVGLEVRNVGPDAWRKKAVTLRLRWFTADGDALPGETRLPLRANVSPGEAALFTGELPLSPEQPGWARLRADLLRGDEPMAGSALPDAWVAVTPGGAAAMLLGMQAPEELAGKDVLAPVVLRNIGFDEWTPDATTLTYQWLAWDGRPLPNVGGSTRLPETVKPGGVVKLDMLVTPPAQPGSYRCAINLLHRGQSVPLLTDAATPALPIAPVRVTSPRWLSLDLSEAANGVAAAAERVPPLGGLDMLETVFPLEEFLPDQTAAPLGYTPGYLGDAANPDWPSFIFPMLRDGRATMVRGLGQAIPLPEKTARALCFVGFNVLETAPAVFTVTYADGTKTDVPVTVAGWLGGPAKNEPVMLSTRYIRTARGDDWYLRGSAFAYRLPLADKPLKSIILPASGAVCLLAITLELAEEARP